MLDMDKHTQPRSDQTNADDFTGGPRTVKVTKVTEVDNIKQPINVDYEGGEGRPYKPNLSMRRILRLGWGKDGHSYVGKSMTLFREPTVKYSGSEQGGIRISHMSDIPKPIHTMITIAKGRREPFTVQPLQLTAGPTLSADDAKLWKSEIDRCTNMAGLSDVTAKIASNKYADSDLKADLMKHYRSAVTAIREEDAAPVVDNPANMDFPPDDADTDKEG